MDLLLNNAHDLVIMNNDLVLIDKDSSQGVKQRIKQNLLWFRGEWFLNTIGGVPYFEYFFIKNPNREIIETILKETILSVDKVKEFTKFSLDFETLTRKLIFDFSVKLNNNETINFNESLVI